MPPLLADTVTVQRSPHHHPDPARAAPGMTLRDYFAAKILPTLLEIDSYSKDFPHETAQQAYAIADAMLWARDK